MSTRIYSLLLSLYPADLRRDFGEEMTQVFLEDLEHGYRVRGFTGAARVWWQSLKEFFRIAIPSGISKREIAVPLIMYFGQEIYLTGIMLLERRNPHAVLPKSMGDMIAVALVAGLVPAFTASVALRVGDRSVPEPLNLSHK